MFDFVIKFYGGLKRLYWFSLALFFKSDEIMQKSSPTYILQIKNPWGLIGLQNGIDFCKDNLFFSLGQVNMHQLHLQFIFCQIHVASFKPSDIKQPEGMLQMYTAIQFGKLFCNLWAT